MGHLGLYKGFTYLLYSLQLKENSMKGLEQFNFFFNFNGIFNLICFCFGQFVDHFTIFFTQMTSLRGRTKKGQFWGILYSW